MKIEQIEQEITKILTRSIEQKSPDIDIEVLRELKNVFSDKDVTWLNTLSTNPSSITHLSYNELSKIDEVIGLLQDKIHNIKSNVETDIFFKEGYALDIDGLKKKYKARKLHKELPNFNFDRLKEMYHKPPKTLPTYYNPDLHIHIDEYVFRKYIIAINQMVFNHMDLVVCAVGDEGAGKSTKVSQDMYMVWWIMTQLGIIEYKYDINEIWVNTLSKFREKEDKYFNEPFRILGLDEGNELNRQDWKDEEVKTFWQRLRRERHNRRIKFICIPVLGELIINIVLSRINFIFNMLNKNETKTGTLYKGDYDFYIIPRGSKVYSPFLKRELSKEEIKNKLYTTLKDKEYLKGLPREIMAKRCHCNGVWGFDEKEYIKELKESNKTYHVGKTISFGMIELFMFYKSNVTCKKLGIKSKDVRYASMHKIINRVNNYFSNDPDLLKKYESIYDRKIEHKNDVDEEMSSKPLNKAPLIS